MSHRSIVMKHSGDVRPSLNEDDLTFIAARDLPMHDFAESAARLYIHTKLDFGQCGTEFPFDHLRLDSDSFASGTFPVYRADLMRHGAATAVVVKKIWCGNCERLLYCTNEAKVSHHITTRWRSEIDQPVPLGLYIGFAYHDVDQYFYLIFEAIHGSVLSDELISAATSQQKGQWLLQLASALYRLHSEHIFHSDIADGSLESSDGSEPNINIMIEKGTNQLKLIEQVIRGSPPC